MKKFGLFILSSLFCLLEACSPASQLQQTAQNSGQGSGQPSGNLQVKLVWTSNLGEQQGFYIEESRDGTNFSQVLTVPDGTNTASVTVPTAGKTYYFRIRGYNQAGDSPYSAVVTASK